MYIKSKKCKTAYTRVWYERTYACEASSPAGMEQSTKLGGELDGAYAITLEDKMGKRSDDHLACFHFSFGVGKNGRSSSSKTQNNQAVQLYRKIGTFVDLTEV